jgi:phosphatidylinositol-3-phosphatase
MRRLLAVATLALLATAACGTAASPANGGPGPTISASGAPPVMVSAYPKVMIIPEENEASANIIGSPNAPYLNRLATTYGNTTNMIANYPLSCPSLAAYIIITSGSQQGICDDATPANRQLTSDNIFRQVVIAGKEWRQYAESMTTNCQKFDGAPGGYLVRHAPPPYYTSERYRCPVWDVPMGTTSAGHLRDDLARGLPALSIVTPNACHDMHGATTCPNNGVKNGDDWLATWVPKIIASNDFQRSQLLVIITWDEGSPASNRISTLLLAKDIHGVTSSAPYTHCSTLRTTEELLQVPYLGCAATAVSFRTAFHI